MVRDGPAHFLDITICIKCISVGGEEVKKRTNFFGTPPLLLSVVGKTSLRGVDGLRNHDCSFNNLKVKYQSRKTELWIKRLLTQIQ